MRRLLLSALLIIVLSAGSGCLPKNEGIGARPWEHQDLRALDPVDSNNPQLDLIAAYSRSDGSTLQIRLDFLEMSPAPDYDLFLILETSPGPAPISQPIGSSDEGETRLTIPAAGPIIVTHKNKAGAVIQQKPGAGLLVIRDPVQDMLTIQLDKRALEASGSLIQPASLVSVSAFISPSKQAQPIDSIGPFSLLGAPPKPVPVLMLFWDTLPAYTPAQTLRRWDGAHTGPLGGRHGLGNLLKAARRNQIPLVLLDLNLPTALSALDTVGGLEQIKDLLELDLLAIPLVLPGDLYSPAETAASAGMPGWTLDQGFESGREAELGFGIPAQPLVYLPAGLGGFELENFDFDGKIRVVFVPNQGSEGGETLRVEDSNGLKVISVSGLGDPGTAEEQAAPDGLSVAARGTLIDEALSAQGRAAASATRIVTLGGSLPQTNWGNPQAAQATLRYIQNHPWIKVIHLQELLAPSPAKYVPGTEITNQGDGNIPSDLEELSIALQNAPRNDLYPAVWQAFQALFAPIYPRPEGLSTLRAFYSRQIWFLLSAVVWAENPQTIADCTSDLDRDGQAECILASETIYAIFELDDGGYISYTFVRTEDGQFHQVIGPSSQFITGQSNPTGWDLQLGLRADPGVIQGAFADPAVEAPERATKYLLPGQLSLTTSSGMRKTFRLGDGEISVEYSGLAGKGFYTTDIPLVIDPWRRFAQGWSDEYHSSRSSNGVTWEIQPGLLVELQGSAEFRLNDFLESGEYMRRPEDPNRDYPPGHFLPFPLALATLSTDGDFTVLVKFSVSP